AYQEIPRKRQYDEPPDQGGDQGKIRHAPGSLLVETLVFNEVQDAEYDYNCGNGNQRGMDDHGAVSLLFS
ncbi:MAG TPA: hypothetical protein DCG65_07515, partial [Hyphomonas atlantica]|nr:hypothetical protein [Hyphomonas atlantica]